MKIKPGTFCPLIQADCKGLECSWFTQIRGINPNSGEEVDEWGCAITWLPMLMIENSGQQRQTGAAVESFRNEMIKAQQVNQQVLLAATNHSMLLEAKS
jgi:hypothetical protein